MNSGGWLQSLEWALAALLGLAGCGVAVWALFWDRARGRRRCPRCWYEMRAVGRCPECGREVREAAELSRTRRRPAAAMVGVVLAGGAWAGFQANGRALHGEGWTRCVPTTVLAVVAPMGDPRSPLTEALVDRGWDTWWWQEAIAARREMAGVSDDSIRGCLGTRAVWPAGAPVVISAGMPSGCEPLVGWRKITVLAGGGAGEGGTLAMWVEGFCPRPAWFTGCLMGGGARCMDQVEIEGLAPGRHEVPYTLVFEGPGGGRREVKTSVVFEVAEPGRAVLGADASAELTDRVRRAVRGAVHREGTGPCVEVRFDEDILSPWRLTGRREDLEIAAVFELWDGGTRLARGDGWLGGLEMEQNGDVITRLFDQETGRWRPEVEDRLEVRVRGDERLACRRFDAARYWAGEFTMPLRRVLEQTPLGSR